MKDRIQKFFKGDIDDSDETLTKYSRDASIFEVRPKLVVFPKDSTDIQNLVRFINTEKKADPTLSLSVRAAGTCMSGGSLTESIVMDVSRYMNKTPSVRRLAPYAMLPHFPGAKEVTCSGEAIVEPGVFYRDLEAETLKNDLLLPCYTASKSINAIGGMIGNNSGGELTLRYGKTEDYIKELKIILADGYEYTIRPISRRDLYKLIAEPTHLGQAYKKALEILESHKEEIKAARPRVSKNSAGYNLWNIESEIGGDTYYDFSQLFVGAQGTLGIVTEVTLRLVDVPKNRAMAVIFLNDLEHLPELVNEILPSAPESIESYDDKTLTLAVKFFPDFVGEKGLRDTIAFGLSFMPEFWMALTGGIPKMIMLVEYASEDPLESHAKAQSVIAIAEKYKARARVTKNLKESEKYWRMRRDSFALLRKHSGTKHTAPFIDDVIVPPSALPTFLPRVNAILAEYKDLMIYTIAGHAANGNFHIIPLMDFSDPRVREVIIPISEKVYALVNEYGGSITAEHNDGIVRTPFLAGMFGENVAELFREVKKAFDPETVFNPGKKVSVTKEYLLSHIETPKTALANKHAS